MWLNQALSIESKGITTTKAKSLADLASRRQETQGQFWTVPWIARKMWDIALTAMHENSALYAVMDNSVGSGRP